MSVCKQVEPRLITSGHCDFVIYEESREFVVSEATAQMRRKKHLYYLNSFVFIYYLFQVTNCNEFMENIT